MGVGTPMTVTDALNLLKIQYGAKIVDQINANFDIVDTFNQFGPEDRIGEKWVTPIKVQMTDNVGYTGSAFQLPATGGNPAWKRVETTEVWAHGTFQLNIQTLTRMRQGDRASYAEAQETITTDLKSAMQWRRSLAFLGGADGIIAKCKVQANASQPYVQVYAPLGWLKGDDSTPMEFAQDYIKTVFPIGSRVYIAAGGGTHEIVTVKGYTNAYTLEMTTNLAYTHALGTAIYFGTTTSLVSNACIRGLRDLFTQNTATAYMGVTPATDSPLWMAQRITGATAGTSEYLDTSHLRRSLSLTENSCGEIPDLWLASIHMLGSFEDLATANTRFSPQQAALGMEAVDYVLPGGRKIKKFIWSRFVPPGMIIGLNTKYMNKYTLLAGELDDTNGSPLHRIENYDVFEGLYRIAENFGTTKRESHVVIQDLNVVA